MQPTYRNPNKSKSIIVSHLQNVALLAMVFFLFQSAHKSFYEGGIQYTIAGLVVMGSLSILAPLNLITASIFLFKQRRNFAPWVTGYMVLSLLISLLLVFNIGALQ